MTKTLEERLSSLDTAFLFLIGSVNFVFSFLQVFVGGKGGFVLFSPLIVVGLFYPFYTGYLRGVVERDSIVERIRGWIYFAMGTTAYLAMLSTVLFRDFHVVSDLTLAAYLVILLAGFYVSHRLTRWLLVVTRAQLSKIDLLLLGATVVSAYCLSAFAFLLQEYLKLWISQPRTSEPPYLPQILSVVPFFAAFLLIERTIVAVLSRGGVMMSFEAGESKGPILITFNGSISCLLIGLLSNAAAFWLAVLSYTLSSLANLFHPQIQFWLQLSALLFAVLALMKYWKSPINIIRTREDVRGRIKEILHVFDC